MRPASTPANPSPAAFASSPASEDDHSNRARMNAGITISPPAIAVVTTAVPATVPVSPPSTRWANAVPR